MSDTSDYTLPTDGDFVSAEIKWAYGCALDGDGNASCWDNSSQHPNNITQRKYHDLALDSWYSCYVVRDDANSANDRKIQCEGWSGFSSYPMVTGTSEFADYTFDAVRLRFWDACGLVRDSDPDTEGDQNKGVIECWGYDQTAAPPVHPVSGAAITFKSFDTNDDTTCGIVDDANILTAAKDDEGKALCWGNPDDGLLEPPENVTFTDDSVRLGSDFACGIIKDGDTTTADENERENQIACWGNNSSSQRTPALGTYSVVGASRTVNGAAFGCAITIDSDLSMSGNQNEGALACWGDLKNFNNAFKNDPGIPDPPTPTATATPTPYRDTIKNVSTGQSTTCMTTEAGVVECFGRSIRGEGDPPDGVRAETVSVGNKHACAISHYGRFGKNPGTGETWYPSDANVVCWGDNTYGVKNVPAGIYKSVESGNSTSCGIRIDPDVSSEYGEIVCWGLTRAPWGVGENAPTTADFVEIKIGYSDDYFRNHACALKNNGEVVCWGDSRLPDDSAEITVPTSTATGGGAIKFKSLAAGQGGNCGIIEDGDPNTAGNQNEDDGICWGHNIANSKPRDHFPYHYVTPVSGEATPTVKFDPAAGPMDLGLYVTCGILKEDYEYVLKGNQTNFSVIRKAGTPYCEGRDADFGATSQTVSYDQPRSVWPWVPSTWYKIRQYFPATVDSADVKYRGLSVSTFHMCVIRYGKDDDPAVGHLVCNGGHAGQYPGNIEPKPIATVDASTAEATYTCGSGNDQIVYNGASPVDGGRYPTASDSPFFTSVAPAGLANNKIIGIRMDAGGSASFSNRTTGHVFSGNLYTATFVNTDSQGAKCDETDQTVTTSRPIDICIPKAENSGRWYDWQLFKIVDGAVSGEPLSGFTELGGSVCAEVTELPVTVAAASKVIPTPTPTPTLTPTAVVECDDAAATTGLTVEKKVGKLDVYVHVPAAALKSIPNACLHTNPATSKVPLTMTADGGILTVSDQYVELNLRAGYLDIEKISAPAVICATAPGDDPGHTALYHLGDDATEWNVLEAPAPASLPEKYRTGFACGLASELSKFAPTTLPGTPPILRFKPNVRSITVSAEDTVRLYVDLWGQDDVRDNTLGAGEVTFDWSIEPRGGSFEELGPAADDNDDADERAIRFIAPSKAGAYTVRVALAAFECGDDDGKADGCVAEIEVIVRREAPTPEPTEIPRNPAGAIPRVIIGKDGKQYAVFTPEEGGEFSDEKVTVHADPGAVPNGEVIGVRADATGPASNVGKVHHRVTLDGEYFDISAVTLSGERLDGYLLDDPATVCLPLSPNLSRRISEASVVTIKDDGSFGALTTSLSLTDEGSKLCGKLIEVPARVAAAHLASPDALPTPSPTPLIIDPDTGGTAPPNNTAALILLILLGTAIITLSAMLLFPKRRAHAT